MAKLIAETFDPTPELLPETVKEVGYLRDALKKIMTKLCGPPRDGSLEYLHPPKNLKAGRDGLKKNFAGIWLSTTIIFEWDNYGASARGGTNEIVFGEFFTKTDFTQPKPEENDLILEKVFLHEFLHLVVDLPKPLHHGQINNIIKKHLRYYGEPNPLGTD